MIIAHIDRNINSHLLSHHVEIEHQCLQNKDCNVTDSHFQRSSFKKKISEALGTKKVKPAFNRQGKPVE